MFLLISSILFFLLSELKLEAGDPQPQTSPVQAQPTSSKTDAGATTKKPLSTRKPKGKRIREREAEGTEAHDRFEADTVIKSQYQFNGEPLEVDPD